MITRIILQKQKYDIQIFPKYSWMTVLFEKILIVKDIMKYFLSKWFSLKRSFERYFYLLSTLIFVIPYWTYWSLVILLTGHMRTRSYENTPIIWLWNSHWDINRWNGEYLLIYLPYFLNLVKISGSYCQKQNFKILMTTLYLIEVMHLFLLNWLTVSVHS